MSNSIKLLMLSFFTAVLGEAVFFVLIDPQTLYLFGQPVDWRPLAVYSGGFFMFWGLTALTAALVALMLKPGKEVNREPVKRSRHAQAGQLRSL